MNVTERILAFFVKNCLSILVAVVTLVFCYSIDSDFAVWLIKTIGLTAWALAHSETAIPALALHFHCTLGTAARIAVLFSTVSLIAMVAITIKLPQDIILMRLPDWLRFERTDFTAVAILYGLIFALVFFPFGGTCASVLLVLCFCTKRWLGFAVTFFSNGLKNLAWGKLLSAWSVRTQIATCLVLLVSVIVVGAWQKRRETIDIDAL